LLKFQTEFPVFHSLIKSLMSIDFIIADRDTPFLFPPSVQDWLPQGYLARFVVDIVSQIDLSSLRGTCRCSRPGDALSGIFFESSTISSFFFRD
jgi:hypothetical protein